MAAECDGAELMHIDESTYAADPHTFYATLRAEGAVRQVVMPGGLKVWLISRYDDARAVLADPPALQGRRNRPTGHHAQHHGEGRRHGVRHGTGFPHAQLRPAR